jgi:Holliday junction resolvase RusA-like endonuclease
LITWKKHIALPITPKSKGRPRVRVVAGHAQTYTPKETVEFERSVAQLLADHRPPSILEGPVTMMVTFVLPRPKRLCRKKDSANLLPCSKKPDIDNLAKSLLDSVNRNGGYWRDDAQLQGLSMKKLYAEKHGQPRIELWIQGECADPNNSGD